MKKLQVLVSAQPMVVSTEFSVWSAVKRLGSKRVRWLFPIKTLLDMASKFSEAQIAQWNP